MYFSFASVCMLTSVSFYYGPLNYVKTLFSAENRRISGLYICSTFASIWAIFTGAGYLWSINLVILQGAAVAFMMLRVFTGAEAAQHKLTALFKSGTEGA
jgi:hypothetical protein